MFKTHMRLEEWRTCRWDASWYCVECHRRNDESEEEVKRRLGMTERMRLRALYVVTNKAC